MSSMRPWRELSTTIRGLYHQGRGQRPSTSGGAGRPATLFPYPGTVGHFATTGRRRSFQLWSIWPMVFVCDGAYPEFPCRRIFISLVDAPWPRCPSRPFLISEM